MALLAFLPKLSVDASGSLRPRDPGGTVFFISNDGVLTLYDLEIRCRVDDIETADGLQLKGATFRFPLGSTAERLESGKKMTAPCQRAIEVTGSPAVRSAMTIIADYKPIKWWFRRREEFHVEAAKSQDGTWIWTHVPS